jgi:ABC-2 type transport system ATP-binding protein
MSLLTLTDVAKRFDGVTAVDGVSFTVDRGQVVGFLGPNGAGKSTTMRMITQYLDPDQGTIQLDGADVGTAGTDAKRRIGYLPENNPLYGDMLVSEYLEFIARLRELTGTDARSNIDEAVAATGIQDVYYRPIGELSKGYRQRVGLADALVHRPEVLILDEPTDGLDPNQRRAMLELIGALGRERTVVLSTHILSEVEAVCGRVVILDRGRVVAEGPLASLLRPHLQIVARGERGALVAALQAIEGVVTVESDGDGELTRLRVTANADVREAAAAAVVRVGHLRELSDVGLAELFARLTSPEKS